MTEITLDITGMTCGHCVSAATKALEGVPGVTHADVTLTPGAAVIHGDADPDALVKAVEEEGYLAQVRN